MVYKWHSLAHFNCSAWNRKMASRNRSRAWFFTVDNAELSQVAQLAHSLESEKLDYVFQLEKAQSGMIHFQGVCRYPNPVSKWPNIRAHWERCRNWRAAVKYCTKTDTRVGGPWTNMENLTWRKTLIDPMSGFTLRAYQKEVIDIINGPVDNRKIYWFWESNGNTGKSTLAKHIVMNYNACLLGAGTKDCLCCLASYMEEKDLDVVIFDIPRCRGNTVSYEVIESVKNGLLFSGKYESNFITFNIPHVIVFSNYEPDRMYLSEDRWVVSHISV